MEKLIIVIAGVLFLALIWSVCKGQKVDQDIDIKKNRIGWWKDKNIK